MPSPEHLPINTFHLTTDHERSEEGRPVLVRVLADGRKPSYLPNEGVDIEVEFTAATLQETPSVQLFTARDLVQNLLSHDGPGRHRIWTEDEREMMAAYLEQRAVRRQAPASE